MTPYLNVSVYVKSATVKFSAFLVGAVLALLGWGLALADAEPSAMISASAEIDKAFITIGEGELEFLQNLDQASANEITYGGSGSTRQDQSVISRYIASRGPGLHHVALKVRDIDGLLATLHQAGHTLIDRVGRPGSRLGRIGFIHPASLGGWLVHLVQREAPASH